jgi:putative oxidoreductase
MQLIPQRFVALENLLYRELARRSVGVLRVAVGAVFLGFGVLKFFPDVSPAQSLLIATTDRLSFDVVPGHAALIGIAALECFIGACMLANRWMRLAIWLLALDFVGILSPLVVLPGRLFSGPYDAPTLEGQYVLKDIVLVAAGMVIAAAAFRGGQSTADEPSSPEPPARWAELAAEHKIRVDQRRERARRRSARRH